MTEYNPPGWLQNSGSTNTAQQLRSYHQVLAAGALSSASLTGRGGVNMAIGNKLLITQTGSPSMAVLAKSGAALVPGTEAGSQGCYAVVNDADVTLTITAAHPTLPRIDVVAFKVQDQAFSGSTNSCSLVVVAGTPAGSPTPPAAPANSIVLANVAVAAAASSIVNANITDKRIQLAAAGGIITCTSTTRPGAGTVPPGQLIYETDTTFVYRTDDGGTSWVKLDFNYRASQVLSGSAASVTFTGIPSTLTSLRVRWTARGDTAAVSTELRVKVNSDGTSNYHFEYLQASSAAAAAANQDSNATWRWGFFPANSATAGAFGTGNAEINGWNSPHSTWLGFTAVSGFTVPANTTRVTEIITGAFAVAGPYNRLDFIPLAGNFVAGTAFYLDGLFS